VAITADHGESLGEHGEETHSMFVYEGAVRVPMVLWRPGTLPAGRVVHEAVRSTDMAPTLLDLLGAPALATESGRSLRRMIDGESLGTPAIYSETLLPQFYMNWAPLRALRDARYKLIDAPRPELYDLVDDPHETRNRYDAQPQTAQALRSALQRLTAGSAGAMSVGSLDREALEKLAALGYLGAGSERAGEKSARADPKDVIEVFNRLRRANSAVRDRRFDEALLILHAVLEADPRNAFAQLVLGSAYMGMGNNAKAVEQYKRYVSLVPTSAYAHQWMAICHLRMGDPSAALREADAALALDPRFSDARVLKGGVLASRGAYDDAVRELRAAVDTDPAKPPLRLDLAKVLAEAGRVAEARTEYSKLLEIQADYAPALVGLGALQARAGALEDASAAFRRAIELDGSLDDARFNLAQVLERQGRRQEARAEYARLLGGASTSEGVRAAAREGLRRVEPPATR
jgi:tetratricopeptide (TPR) repeat protein